KCKCSAQPARRGGQRLSRAAAALGHRHRNSHRDDLFFTRSGLHIDSIPREVWNTAVRVWTVGERFGIGTECRQTCCAANNFRDHDLTSPLNSFPLPDPTHALWIGSDISP